MSFWDDFKDAVSSDTFYTVVGVAGIVTGYGGVEALLDATGAEKVAVEQTMSAVAGTLLLGKDSLWEGWKAQAQWRGAYVVDYFVREAKKAGDTDDEAAARGREAGESFSREISGYTNDPGWVADAQAGYQTVKASGQSAMDYLHELEKRCAALRQGSCREDALALAANAANGETIFDTDGWDPATGRAFIKNLRRPGGLSERLYSIDDLYRIADEAEKRHLPAAIVQAFRQRADDARSRTADTIGGLQRKASMQLIALPGTEGPGPSIAARGALFDVLGPLGKPAAALWPLNVALFEAALYTSPLWGGYLAWRWYGRRKRRA